MVSLTRYFLLFFFICLIMTCICGVIAASLPQGVGGILTVVNLPDCHDRGVISVFK